MHRLETATPRFLVDTLIERGFSAPDLEGLHADDDLLSAFDVASVGTEALLFQAGYLTIIAEEKLDGYAQYRLGYPNREVRRGLNRGLLDALARGPENVYNPWAILAPSTPGATPADRSALTQLKARRYGDKYRAPNRTVYLIGVEIGTEERDLIAFDVEPG